MQLTLLQIVQRMLAAIDAENVTDVGETQEADMCVHIANRVFEQIAVSKRWRHFKAYDTLETTANKNELAVPSGTYALDPYAVYYNDNLISYKTPEDFLFFTTKRDVTESNIVSVNNIEVYDDRDPIWFTSDDDETLRFDAYPDASGLVGSNSKCIVYKLPTTLATANADLFDLPQVMYPALVEYAVGRAVVELQQNAEGNNLINEAKRMLARLSRNSRLVEVKDDLRKWIVPRRTSSNVHRSTITYNGQVIT